MDPSRQPGAACSSAARDKTLLTRAWRACLIFGLLAVMHPRHASAQGEASVRTLTDTLIGAVGGVAVDGIGNIYVADFGENVYKVKPDGRVTLFATGLYGSSGNTVDAMGNLLQSSFTGSYITKIDRHGNQEIYATGLSGPVGLAFDGAGNLYANNCTNNTISRINGEGEVTEFVSSDLLNCPNGLTFGPDSNLYVVNFSDERVLRVTLNGEISEFATLPGGGNGHITSARGALYATSFQGNRIYRISLAGEVSPLAGTGAFGQNDGPGSQATFIFPNGIAATARGDRLYVNDYLNRAPPTREVMQVPVSIVRQIMLPTLSQTLTAALQQGGIEAMTASYRSWKADPGTGSLFTQIEINAMGYALMNNGQLPAAIRVFELNAESYPNAFNTWDSLAESYMNNGQNELAIENYRKSLRLNPGNTNAVAMLERLGTTP